jgi:hypothetical protein
MESSFSFADSKFVQTGKRILAVTEPLPAADSISIKLSVPRQGSNLLVGVCNLVNGKPENLVAMNGTSNSLNFSSKVDGLHGFSFQEAPFKLINTGRLCLATANLDNDAWEDLVWDEEDIWRDEKAMPDFDEEARKLFEKHKLPTPITEGKDEDDLAEIIDDLWKSPSCLWEHPTTGAKFYCGAEMAAKNKDLMEKLGIFNVIYAKSPNEEELYFSADERFTYMTFHIQSCP